jgi:hypothetical protein
MSTYRGKVKETKLGFRVRPFSALFVRFLPAGITAAGISTYVVQNSDPAERISTDLGGFFSDGTFISPSYTDLN